MVGPRHQYMILSLPNSGTDWLCPLLAEHGGLRYYDKEFFNPICNPQHRGALELAFGCELVSCYRNIGIRASAHVRQLEAIYRGTWCQHDWNFDKENFSAFSAPFFAQHFRLAVLLRPAESLFPPSRLRVLAWYDAIWNSLVEAGHVERRAMALESRAREAHRICSLELTRCAARLCAPVLDYDLLCTAAVPEVQAHLSQGWIGEVVDTQSAAAEIVTTRRYRAKTASPPAV